LANTQSPRKELESAWVVLRLALRNAAKQYAPRLLERASGLGAQPSDPAQVEPIARKLNEMLGEEAGAGQASPTLRLLKNTFRPSDAERERRNLEKAFNAYLELWNKKG
jgi:hypothetical protein